MLSHGNFKQTKVKTKIINGSPAPVYKGLEVIECLLFMSVLDLRKRATDNWTSMHEHLQSPDSYIYIGMEDGLMDAMESNPISLDLKVGSSFILPGSNRSFLIPNKGLVIKPKQSVVIFTQQRVKLPYNVFGVVTGKGAYIYKGCFLSTGKVDPAFEGNLKIGFFNGSKSSVTLEKGMPFATVYFLNTDSTLTAPLKDYHHSPTPDVPKLRWYIKVWMYMKEHFISFIAWLVLAVPAAIYYVTQVIDWLKE